MSRESLTGSLFWFWVTAYRTVTIVFFGQVVGIKSEKCMFGTFVYLFEGPVYRKWKRILENQACFFCFLGILYKRTTLDFFWITLNTLHCILLHQGLNITFSQLSLCSNFCLSHKNMCFFFYTLLHIHIVIHSCPVQILCWRLIHSTEASEDECFTSGSPQSHSSPSST